MSKWWKWNLHGHASLAPFTLAYAVFCFIVYGARSWGVRSGVVVAIGDVNDKGVTRIWGRPGAQTIGACQCYADSTQINRVDLHVHENCHVVQAMAGALLGQALVPLACVALDWNALLGCALGGPIGAAGYALAYGICFLVPFAAQGFARWHDAYRKNPFEVQAYARQARWLEMTTEQRARVWS
jgi:hypothetical protein